MPALDKCPHLSPCPFCGAALDARWDRPNPFARCRTSGCMAQSLPVLCLDDPEAVARWNTRASGPHDRLGPLLQDAMPHLPGEMQRRVRAALI